MAMIGINVIESVACDETLDDQVDDEAESWGTADDLAIFEHELGDDLIPFYFACLYSIRQRSIG